MKQDEYLKWQSRVAELTEEQSRDLLARMRALKQIEVGVDTNNPNLSEDWLLAGIMNTFQAKGIINKTSFGVVLHSRGCKEYKKVASQLTGQMEELLPGPHRRAAWRSKLACVVAEALIHYARCYYPPYTAFTPGMILMLAPYTLEALEACFPGYIKAGVFHMIIERGELK